MRREDEWKITEDDLKESLREIEQNPPPKITSKKQFYTLCYFLGWSGIHYLWTDKTKVWNFLLPLTAALVVASGLSLIFKETWDAESVLNGVLPIICWSIAYSIMRRKEDYKEYVAAKIIQFFQEEYSHAMIQFIKKEIDEKEFYKTISRFMCAFGLKEGEKVDPPTRIIMSFMFYVSQYPEAYSDVMFVLSLQKGDGEGMNKYAEISRKIREARKNT